MSCSTWLGSVPNFIGPHKSFAFGLEPLEKLQLFQWKESPTRDYLRSSQNLHKIHMLDIIREHNPGFIRGKRNLFLKPYLHALLLSRTHPVHHYYQIYSQLLSHSVTPGCELPAKAVVDNAEPKLPVVVFKPSSIYKDDIHNHISSTLHRLKPVTFAPPIYSNRFSFSNYILLETYFHRPYYFPTPIPTMFFGTDSFHFLLLLTITISQVYCIPTPVKHVHLPSSGRSVVSDIHSLPVGMEQINYTVPSQYTDGIEATFSEDGHVKLNKAATELIELMRDRSASTQNSPEIFVSRLHRHPCAFNVSPATYFTPTVYSAVCMCGSSGLGRAYAVDNAMEVCMKICMGGYDGSTCYAMQLFGGFNNEFDECCQSCGGTEDDMTVETTYSSPFVGNFKSCVAPYPIPTPTLSPSPSPSTSSSTSTSSSPSPSPSASFPCSIEVSEGSDLSIPHLTKTCFCSTFSRGRTFVVSRSVKECVQSCISADEGTNCEMLATIPAALIQFRGCCKTCDGNVVSVGFEGSPYPGCM